jgi:hypothetical protein
MSVRKNNWAVPLLSIALLITIVASTAGQAPINITGFLSDPNGAPIPGAPITLYSLDRIAHTTSDSTGHFQFGAVSSGEFEIEAMAPGFRTFKQVYVADSKQKPDKMELTIPMQIAFVNGPIIVMSAPEMEREIASRVDCGPRDAVTYGPRKAPDAVGLTGIVNNRYPKVPVTGASIDLVNSSGEQIAHEQTNERGEFQFKQTRPGRYQLVFQHAGYSVKKSFEFWITRENLTYLTLQAEQPGTNVICR